MTNPHPIVSSWPSNITTVEATNFRGFKSTGQVRLSAVTFLVGPNSSGKSSLADVLLLLAQSRFAPAGTFVPRWSGSLVDLGSYKDTVYQHNKNLGIRIAVGLEQRMESEDSRAPRDDRRWSFRIVYTLRAKSSDDVGELREVSIEDDASGYSIVLGPRLKHRIRFAIAAGEEIIAKGHVRPVLREAPSQMLFQRRVIRAIESTLVASEFPALATDPGILRIRNFLESRDLWRLWAGTERVSSSRGGPQRWYSTEAAAQELAWTQGNPALLDRVDPSIVGSENVVARLRHTYHTGGDRSLATVLRSLEIADRVEARSISPYHTSIRARDNITRIESNLMELGYGASQVIPVIKGCLSGSISPLFVEQPEIHLHPRAQGSIADLLIETSAQRQVIIETHSVRMINRARLAIAAGKLHPEHVNILYVSRTRTGSHVKQIELDEKGDFKTAWPGGFFDERYEDTMELLRLRSTTDQSE